jgi:MFS family permease
MRPARAWLRTTFSSLQVPNFRTYYLGQTASMVGTWVRRTALGWVIYEMTGSRAMLGTVMGLALLPMFLLSPLAGTIADRVDKRKMVILTQLLASASSAATAMLVMTGWAEPWHLMALATSAASPSPSRCPRARPSSATSWAASTCSTPSR